MQIHNDLRPVRRERTMNALDAIAANLANCRPSPDSTEDELLFNLEGGSTGVETLKLRLRNRVMTVFVATRHDGRVRRTSFVEHLRPETLTGATTMAEAVSRLSDWR